MALESISALGNMPSAAYPVENGGAVNAASKTAPAASSTASSEEYTKQAKRSAETAGVVQQLFSDEKKETNPEKDAEKVSEIVETLQDSMDMIRQRNTHLLFSVHEDTEEIMVKITDQASGDVIREIPSEEFLDLAAKFEEMVGLMFDMRA